MKQENIPDPIYHNQIVLIYDFTLAEIEEWVKTHNLGKACHNLLNPALSGQWINTETEDGLRINYIFINTQRHTKKHWQIAVLNHELFHLVHHCLKYIGIKYSGKSEEAYSYYLQYLTYRCGKYILKK